MQKTGIVIADGNAILTHITEMWDRDKDQAKDIKCILSHLLNLIFCGAKNQEAGLNPDNLRK